MSLVSQFVSRLADSMQNLKEFYTKAGRIVAWNGTVRIFVLYSRWFHSTEKFAWTWFSVSCRIYGIFFCELHLYSIDRDIEGELAKSPKMVSNVQQLMFIGKFLFYFIWLPIYSALCYCKLLFFLLHQFPVRAIKVFCSVHFFELPCFQCWRSVSAYFWASRIRIPPFSHKGVEQTEIMLAK